MGLPGPAILQYAHPIVSFRMVTADYELVFKSGSMAIALL